MGPRIVPVWQGSSFKALRKNPCLGGPPLPPSPNEFHEGSCSFLGILFVSCMFRGCFWPDSLQALMASQTITCTFSAGPFPSPKYQLYFLASLRQGLPTPC